MFYELFISFFFFIATINNNPPIAIKTIPNDPSVSFSVVDSTMPRDMIIIPIKKIFL